MPSLKYQGKASSTTSTSLENLDKTLPEGVVSKKFRGKRKTLFNKRLCINTAAVIQPNAGTTSMKTEKIAEIEK